MLMPSEADVECVWIACSHGRRSDQDEGEMRFPLINLEPRLMTCAFSNVQLDCYCLDIVAGIQA